MWEQIHANKVRSMVVVTVLAVLLMVIGAGVGVVLGGPNASMYGAAAAFMLWFVLWLTTMSSGDQVLLSMARARELPHGELPQLRNLVEEMTIAAGLDKTPRVYVIDDPAPNAFAAGRKPENAVVAVTTGLLAMLDRDELQGVIAHEIGHIKNRDVALMTTAGIMLGAIVMLGEFTMRSLWWGGGYRSRSSNNSNGAAAVIGILVIVLAPILAQVLYFALSRRREYLADASGARFTRYPEGLASALEKIGGVDRPQADQSRVTAPMYIVRPLRKGESKKVRASWFATHPPIQERVRILRAMGGGAGYADYERACLQVTGKSMVGERSIAADGSAVTAHAPAFVAPAVAEAAAPAAASPAAPPGVPPRLERRRRRREASDAFLSASGYEKRTCSACRAVIKVPPSMRDQVRACPRCAATL